MRSHRKVSAATSPIPGHKTLAEIAVKFDRCHATVFKWLAAGYFGTKVVKINRQYFVPDKDVDEFVVPPMGNPIRRKQSPALAAWEAFLKRRKGMNNGSKKSCKISS